MTGERIAGNNKRRLQAREPKPTEWNAAKRARFLDHLAATCNVVQSARAAGMSSGAAHALRRRDPAFAELWEAAITAGYQYLETKLLAHALGTDGAGDDPAGTDPGKVDTGPFDPAAAMELIRQRNAALAAGANGGARRKTPYAFKHAPIEEVRESLMTKLAALARHKARSARP